MVAQTAVVNPAWPAQRTGGLAAWTPCGPRQRLQQLLERMQDTETLLGSDVLATALEAYGLLKVSGRSQGLGSLRAGLGSRFKAQGRRAGAANDEDDGTTEVA